MPHCLPRPLAPSRLARENHKATAALRQMKINVLLCNSLSCAVLVALRVGEATSYFTADGLLVPDPRKNGHRTPQVPPYRTVPETETGSPY